MWKPPKKIILSAGTKASEWIIAVRVLRLAEFEKQYYEPCNTCGRRDRGALPRAFWCETSKAIYLREDRKHLDTFRLDAIHEADHAYIDWRGHTFEQ